jgi:hypothetical protein
LEVEEQEL